MIFSFTDFILRNLILNSAKNKNIHGPNLYIKEKYIEKVKKLIKKKDTLPDLKPRRIHTVHPGIVEVITEGQNKVRSHLRGYLPHLPGGGLLHGGHVGRVGHSAPVSNCQELNRRPVLCGEEVTDVRISTRYPTTCGGI